MTGPRHSAASLAWIASAALVSCTTTPLPIPPTIDPESIGAMATNGPSMVLTGRPGAIDPGGRTIRVTRVEQGWGVPADFVEAETAPDGSFEVEVPGTPADLFYFELLADEEDVFLIALAVQVDGTVLRADPGPDRDDDGSPDAIDCAPDDPSRGGRRCR